MCMFRKTDFLKMRIINNVMFPLVLFYLHVVHLSNSPTRGPGTEIIEYVHLQASFTCPAKHEGELPHRD